MRRTVALSPDATSKSATSVVPTGERPRFPGMPSVMRLLGAFSSVRLRKAGPAGRQLLLAACACGLVLLSGCERTESVQWGFRGNSMIQLYKTGRIYDSVQLNQIPPPEPSDPYDPGIPLATEVNENVQVLTDLNALEFARLMQAISTWVAPEQGCEYCHNTENLASDEKYTKLVARNMIQMTRDINTNWQSHVVKTGVTCWTCHRGKNVPSDIWFNAPEPKTPSAGISGNKAGQNTAGVKINGNSSLPFDPLTPFLEADNQIGVQGMTVLPSGNRRSIKQTEWTYALMMYMSNSLGVNCTYCHQTRAMGRWDESTPQRVTAWHGIRMVRDINNNYLVPLKPLYPAHRLGPTGDAPKTACATCHKGAFKPLFGVSMLGDYPSLAGVIPGRLKPVEPVEQEPSEPESAAPAEEPAAESGAPDAVATAAGSAAAAEEAPAADDAETAPAAEAAEAPATAAPEAAAEAAEAAGPAAAQPLVSEVPEAAETDQVTAAEGEAEQAEPSPEVVTETEAEAPAAEPAAGPAAVEAAAPEQIAETEPAAESEASGEGVEVPVEAPMTADESAPEVADEQAVPTASEAKVAELESVVSDLRDQLAAVIERDVVAGSAEPAPQGLLGSPEEASTLPAEIDRLRAALSLQSPDLQTAKHFALALNAAEERLEAVEARLEHERATLQERLALALLQRDEALEGAEAGMARMSEAHAAAMAEAEERIKALESRLQEVQKRLDELSASKGDAAKPSGTDASDAGDGNVGTDADAGVPVSAAFVAGEHGAALDAAEQRISALHARLAQERAALKQQLDVVRSQRDDTAEDVESRLTKQHQAELREAEQRIGALGARLDQERIALQQQLEVVRAQRDGVASQVESKLREQYEEELDAARTRIGALQARLDQERTALQQQLEVVRAQRDAPEAEVADDVEALVDETEVAELETARRRIGALKARLTQERKALQQQLEVVRAQRDGVAAEVEAQLTRQHAAALAELEQRVSAARAKLENQRTALEQQLALVRSQRDSAIDQRDARPTRAAYEQALEAADRRVRAALARLDNERTALNQQLALVRSQRDAAIDERDARPTREAHQKALEEADQQLRAALARLDNERTALQQQLAVARSEGDAATEAESERVARLTEELEAERSRLDELRRAQADADKAVQEMRDQMKSMAADAERQLAEAEAVTNSVQSLFDSAAELGGEVTDEGVRVSLGGDQLQFASGSATLPAGELPTIDRTAALLVSRPDLTARIEGHTDSAGGAELNQALSRQRAEAVMQALIARGVDAARLTAEGLGEERPIADNNTAEGRRQNRRVEIYLMGENLTNL